nr:MAG TPA: hypothetical protein [Caudoviricetes sp.]
MYHAFIASVSSGILISNKFFKYSKYSKNSLLFIIITFFRMDLLH